MAASKSITKPKKKTAGKNKSSAGKSRTKSTNTPAYQRVADHVQNMVQEGKLAAGSMLPSERALADQFSVCHLTVRKGLSLLVKDGLIERQVGQGTFVADAANPRVSAAAQAGSAAVATPGNAVALCVVPSKTDTPMMGYAINGVRSVFGNRRYPLEIIEFPQGGCTDAFWEMTGDRLQGLIIQGYVSENDAAQLDARGIKYVSVGLQVGRPDIPWVHIDFENMLERIVREAYRFGHRSIGIVRWGAQAPQRAPDYDTPPTIEAYRHACHSFDMPLSADRIYQLPEVQRPDASLVDTRPVLQDLDNLPSLLITTDEVMANALLRDFVARGIKVPEDISLVCLLDSTPNAHTQPLSGVDAAAEYMSIYQKASRMLLSQIEGSPLLTTREAHKCKVHFKASLSTPKPSA